jgi:hypothetical protein
MRTKTRGGTTRTGEGMREGDDGRHEDRSAGRQRGARIGDRGWWVEGARSLPPLKHVVEVERVGTCCWSLPLPEPAVRNQG